MPDHDLIVFDSEPPDNARVPLTMAYRVIDTYLNSLQSAKSREAMTSALKRLAAVSGHPMLPYQMSAFESVRSYENAIETRKRLIECGKWSHNTVNHTLSAMRGLAETLFKMGVISGDHFARIKAVENVKGADTGLAGRLIAQDELDAIYAHLAEKENLTAIRNTALFAILQHGLRVSELVSLTVASYDGKLNRLTVVGKGNKTRVVPLGATAVKRLDAWLKVRGNAPGALFCALTLDPVAPQIQDGYLHITRQAITNLIKRVIQKAGLADMSPHDFRRWFVSHLLDANLDYGQIQTVTGHADISTVARYDRRDDEATLNAVRDVM